ncbi:hypothetical protein QJS66_19675 [Kocuria rhizophila]|nr:hypothetical protein QJS66_19675 [Kocuria rhizophila]
MTGERAVWAAAHRGGLRRCGARVVINYRSSSTAAQELTGPASVHNGLWPCLLTSPIRAGVGHARARPGALRRPVTTVVNNALADFSFNGDARSGCGSDWLGRVH